MIQRKLFLLKYTCFLLSFLLILCSCSQKHFVAQTFYQFKGVKADVDYSDLNYWAAHPWKKNNADTIPLSLQNIKRDSLADVFFIYPTTYTDTSMPMGWNAYIDDETLNQKTDNTTILYQASVFNNHCRIFSPRYRQANIKAFYTTEKSLAAKAFDVAYADIKRAFEYYLQNYNHDRPIIIASHSQGTLHAGRLLKEFFEGKELSKKLVCAYIIGLPVFETYFKELKPCEDSIQTGCFVSWRTFKEGYVPEFVKNEKQKAYVTNPLTWTQDETFAPAKLNKGGILKNFNKIIPGLVHAQIHGNILWVSKPKFFGNVFLTAKNYHIADYNLFYMNIRENAATRINSYLHKK
ncbi:MAG: DUF3089 domain-containing protein [Bacteroidota bacterium]|nr:DUF3089 domain-containing protein [Bacteroidota bacterium]